MDSGNSDDYGFWHGLLKGRISVKREYMAAKWAGAGTFSWFLYMLLFASFVSYLYFQSGQTAEAAAIIAVFIALNAGALVAIYLATLADGTHQDEAEEKNPFALSLQAVFIESLVVASTLLYVVGKYIVDHFNEIKLSLFKLSADDLFNIKQLAEQRSEGQQEPYLISYIGAVANSYRHVIVLTLLLVITVGVMWVAHRGFVLLKRRHSIAVQFNGTHQNEGEPPISSDGLKKRIAHLHQLRADLLAKADRETAAAAKHDRLAAEAEKHMQETELLQLDLLREAELLSEDLAAYRDTLNVVRTQHESLVAKAADPARSYSRKFLAKIADLTESAIRLLTSGDRTFEDAQDSLNSQIESAKSAYAIAATAKKCHEAAAQEHHGEKDRLYQEATTLDAETADLDALAAKIDETNDEWKKPFDWTAEVRPRSVRISHVIPSANYHSGTLAADHRDMLPAIQNGTFILFLFATFFLVVDDLLFDVYKFKPSIQASLFGDLGYGWWIYLGWASFAVLIFWVLKALSMLGFMGSWRAIMVAPITKNDADEGCETDYERMKSVVAANLFAVLAFSVLLAIIVVALGFTKVSATLSPAWYFVAGLKYMPILPYLGFAAGLVVVAPVAVFVFEQYVRKDRSYRGIVQQLLFVFLVTIVVLIAAAFGALGSLIGTVAQERIKVARPPVVAISPDYTQSHMFCPITAVNEQTYAAAASGVWAFAQPNLDTETRSAQTPTNAQANPQESCKLYIGKYGNSSNLPTYIVVAAGASQEGKPQKEEPRSGKRATFLHSTFQIVDDVTAAQLPTWKEGDPEQKFVDVYLWSLGQFSSKQLGLNHAQTGFERPVIVILGSGQDQPNVEEVKDTINKKLKELAVITNGAPKTENAFDNLLAKYTQAPDFKRIVPKSYQICPNGTLLAKRDALCPEFVQPKKPATKQ